MSDMSIRRLPAIIMLLLLTFNTQAQFADPNAKNYNPVKCSYSSEKVGDKEFDLLITAKIEKGWHVYSQFIEEGGPIPTSFRFEPSAAYSLKGKVTESPKAVSALDRNFDMQIAWHKDQVVFRQRIILNKDEAVIPGVLEFMVCNDERCLPPEEVEFEIRVVDGNTNATKPVNMTEPVNSETSPADSAGTP